MSAGQFEPVYGFRQELAFVPPASPGALVTLSSAPGLASGGPTLAVALGWRRRDDHLAMPCHRPPSPPPPDAAAS